MSKANMEVRDNTKIWMVFLNILQIIDRHDINHIQQSNHELYKTS